MFRDGGGEEACERARGGEVDHMISVMGAPRIGGGDSDRVSTTYCGGDVEGILLGAGLAVYERGRLVTIGASWS